MKTVTKNQVKQKMVGSVVASLKIEKLQPNPSIVTALNACVNHGGSTQLLIDDVLAKNVSLRSR